MIAVKLLEIRNSLDKADMSNDWYEETRALFSNIKISDIPTVSQLRKICKNESHSDYEELKFPEVLRVATVVIEEVSNNSKESEEL